VHADREVFETVQCSPTKNALNGKKSQLIVNQKPKHLDSTTLLAVSHLHTLMKTGQEWQCHASKKNPVPPEKTKSCKQQESYDNKESYDHQSH